MGYAIEVCDVHKSLGGREVVHGLDFTVAPGTVMAVLGPNGAGKTTTVRMLTTLLSVDHGRAVVAGHDVSAEPSAVRSRIGLAGQYAALDERLTARENLRLIGTLQRLGRHAATQEADRLVVDFGLEEHADRQVRSFSGGMRRRIDLAASLIGRPQVLFLDEPTTGLDPTSRAHLWQLVRDEVARGLTVLLTTQYLDEADRLADDVIVIDDGRIVAQGSPAQLKRVVGGEQVRVRLPTDADAERFVRHLVSHHAGIGAVATGQEVQITSGDGGLGDVAAVTQSLLHLGVGVEELGLHRPTLDDVFASLTEKASS